MSKNLTVSSVSYSAISAAAASVTPETTVVENPTATAEEAPYLPKIVSDGEWDLDAQCKEAADMLGCSFEEARFYWNALLSEVAKILTDGEHTSVEFGYWRFALAISGSVPYANAAPTAENEVYVAVYPSQQLQDAAASIQTKVDAASRPFTLGCVFDVATFENRLHAGHEGIVMGTKLSMGAEGEKVELIAPDGTAHPCVVTSHPDALPTRIYFTCPNVPDGKKYVLRVTAKGMGGEEPTAVDKCNVEVVGYVPAPEPYAESSDGLVKITSFRRNADGTAELVVDTAMGQSTTLRFGGTGLDLLWNAPGGRYTPLITLCCGDTEDQNLMCSGQPHGDYLLADWTPSSVCGWEAGEHDVTVKVSYGAEDPEILSFHATFNIAE